MDTIYACLGSDGWTFLHSMITYNRTDLLRIRNVTGTGLYATSDVSVTPLCVLNNRRTRRGCRAGRSKLRPIAVLINPRPPSLFITRRRITTQNLNHVQLNSEHVMPPVCQVSFCFLNARSVCDMKQDGKATVICDHIDDNNLDILSAGRICYQLLLVQRAHGTGGGVAVVYKSSFVTRQLDTPNSNVSAMALILLVLSSSTARCLTPKVVT